MLWAVVTSIVACAGSHTYHRLNNGDIDQASAAGSGHRNGSLRRHGKFNETAVSSCSKRPTSSPRTSPQATKSRQGAAPASGQQSAPYLRSLSGCRWADPWLSSSGSPAGTLPDLHAAAALCQSGTGGTTQDDTAHYTCNLSTGPSVSSLKNYTHSSADFSDQPK